MSRTGPLDLRLVAITDRARHGGADGLVEAARLAIAGGLPALAMREKDLPAYEAERLARRLLAECRAGGTLFVVNGDPTLARAVGADGFHTGARGVAVDEARRRLGPEIRIGYSAHEEDEALRAFEAGADCVYFSPIFATPAKRGAELAAPVGVEALARLVVRAPGPVVALGGIDASNAAEVAATGAAGVAAIRAVFGAGDPKRAVRKLLDEFGRGRDRSPSR